MWSFVIIFIFGEGYFQEKLKHAYINYIYQKDDLRNKEDYRAASITSKTL